MAVAGSVVVRKVRVEVARRVVWMWSVVWGERARGRDNCLGGWNGAGGWAEGRGCESLCGVGVGEEAMRGMIYWRIGVGFFWAIKMFQVMAARGIWLVGVVDD